MTELQARDINWARKITERLRIQATNYAEAREKVIATLHEARDGGAAELLGYTSWPAYMADVFADAPLRLERDARQELVAELAAEGMSTRAIAPIVGASVGTIHADIAGVQNRTPEPAQPERQVQYDDGEWSRDVEPARTMMQFNDDTGKYEDVPARHVTGMDGKEYAVPKQPKKPNRRALTEVARDTGWDIRKAVEKLERIREDRKART